MLAATSSVSEMGAHLWMKHCTTGGFCDLALCLLGMRSAFVPWDISAVCAGDFALGLCGVAMATDNQRGAWEGG